MTGATDDDPVAWLLAQAPGGTVVRSACSASVSLALLEHLSAMLRDLPVAQVQPTRVTLDQVLAARARIVDEC